MKKTQNEFPYSDAEMLQFITNRVEPKIIEIIFHFEERILDSLYPIKRYMPKNFDFRMSEKDNLEWVREIFQESWLGFFKKFTQQEQFDITLVEGTRNKKNQNSRLYAFFYSIVDNKVKNHLSYLKKIGRIKGKIDLTEGEKKNLEDLNYISEYESHLLFVESKNELLKFIYSKLDNEYNLEKAYEAKDLIELILKTLLNICEKCEFIIKRVHEYTWKEITKMWNEENREKYSETMLPDSERGLMMHYRRHLENEINSILEKFRKI